MSWICALNLVDLPGVMVTASSEVATMPVSNLQRRQVGKLWRTQSENGWFQVDFGSDQSIDTLAFLVQRFHGHDANTEQAPLAADDQVLHQLWSDGQTPGVDTPVYNPSAENSNIHIGFGYHTHLISTPQTARYWRCTITGTSRAALGYFDIGRPFAGLRYSPPYNFVYGAGQGWTEKATIPEAERTATQFPSAGEKYRVWDVTYLFPETAEESFEDVVRDGGQSGQMLFGRKDTDLARNVLLCVEEGANQAVHTSFELLRQDFTFRESR